MKLGIFILQNVFRKYLFNMDFLKKYNAENLQDFAQTQPDLEFFLDDCDQNINADGNPNLGLYCVLGSSKEGLDFQILFDPFEKDFYSPAAFVKLSNRQCRQSKVVC